MTPEITRKLMAAAGGNKAFCLKLDLDYSLTMAKRVDRWRQRGIPPHFQLSHRNELARMVRNAKRRGLL